MSLIYDYDYDDVFRLLLITTNTLLFAQWLYQRMFMYEYVRGVHEMKYLARTLEIIITCTVYVYIPFFGK